VNRVTVLSGSLPGDALATWFEARSCERTQSVNECGGLSIMAGLHIAKLCYETLLAYGVSARLANEAHVVTPAEANVLLSGLGFESGGLAAAAHAIHNGLTALPETHAFYPCGGRFRSARDSRPTGLPAFSSTSRPSSWS